MFFLACQWEQSIIDLSLIELDGTRRTYHFLKGEEMRWQSILVLAMVVLSAPFANANVTFNDGQTHNIDYKIVDNILVDWEAPGMQTTVNWLTGGATSIYYQISAWEESNLNILGGSISCLLSAHDSSQVDILAGVTHTLHAYDNSRITISGGSIWELHAASSRRITISGGSVSQMFVGDGCQEIGEEKPQK